MHQITLGSAKSAKRVNHQRMELCCSINKRASIIWSKMDIEMIFRNKDGLHVREMSTQTFVFVLISDLATNKKIGINKHCGY